MSLPACEARTVHVPAATIVTVLPATVHVPPDVLLKVTTRVELAVALTVNGASPKDLSDKGAKLIVCDFLTIVSLSVALLLARLASTTLAGRMSDAVLSSMPVAVSGSVPLTTKTAVPPFNRLITALISPLPLAGQ